MKKYRETPRKNGFERPFNGFQILSWILFGLNIMIYVFIIIPSLPFDSKLTLILLFSIFCLFTAFFGFKATIIDPTDSTVYEERNFLKRNLEYITDLKQFCTVCNTHVKPRTKHCGQCNRCAEIFDHHCKWLNNCVGAKNYRWFILLISALFVLMIVKTSSTIYNIVLFNKCHEEFEGNIFHFYNLSGESNNVALAFYVLILIFFLQDPVIIFLLLDLMILHIFLRIKRMTTYEFIILQRSAKEKSQVNVKKSMQGRSKPIIKIESQEKVNNQFLNPNFFAASSKDKNSSKLAEYADSKKNSAITNQSSFKESKKTIDFNSVLDENKRIDSSKKNAFTKWNSNSTTPQNFINEIDDYTNNSSIFADIETRTYDTPKPVQKSQQSMMFKKKLNNILAIPELQETGYLNEPITYMPHKRRKDSALETSNNLMLEGTQNKDDSTLEILNCKKNETNPNIIVLNEEHTTYHLPNIVHEEENKDREKTFD